jgi:hypothetical protein
MWVRVIVDLRQGQDGRLAGTVASAAAVAGAVAAVPFDGIIELVGALESALASGAGELGFGVGGTNPRGDL